MTRVAVYAWVAWLALTGSTAAQVPDSTRTPAPIPRDSTQTGPSRAVADSLRMRAAGNQGPSRAGDAMDRVVRTSYLRRHAFSLDHFLEFEPGGFVVRRGPIGNDASYSRWGIGRGRALLRLNGIALNDPQNDVAPLVHVPTSGLGVLSMSRETGVPWIEGILDIDELPAPRERPSTFVELSKGDNAVRQRRVRFSSEESKIGVDLAYDEVLDNGYDFDASDQIPYVVDYGRARSRNSTVVLRGTPDEQASFDAGVRNFTSSTQGDLSSNTSEGRKNGHVLWVGAGLADTRLVLYGRGYSSSVPDSSSESESVGGFAEWASGGPRQSSLTLRAGVERTDAFQDVGPTTNDHMVRASGSVDAVLRSGEHRRLTASGRVAGDERTPFAWGASVGTQLGGETAAIGVLLARSFRLPNFGERFLPTHGLDSLTLTGNADLDPETAWEATGDWHLRLGRAANRVRVSWIRAESAIAFRPSAGQPDTVRVASNADEDSRMLFLEERVSGDWQVAGIRILADLAGMYSSGDRENAFASVPKFQVNGSLLFGRDFFETTSAIFLGASVLSADERVDYDGARLSSFTVLNFILEARLLDARMYLQYLNALDEPYRTQGDYLMTPRSFVYGIEWTLFN
jgi:TonB-dependent receptor-like protein